MSDYKTNYGVFWGGYFMPVEPLHYNIELNDKADEYYWNGLSYYFYGYSFKMADGYDDIGYFSKNKKFKGNELWERVKKMYFDKMYITHQNNGSYYGISYYASSNRVMSMHLREWKDFTIKRINKGLKRLRFLLRQNTHFTIKRINKGLKPHKGGGDIDINFTIKRINKGLKLI